MKNFNGSDCTFNQYGFITEMKDAEGRSWAFTYVKEQVVAYTDPQGVGWCLDVDHFVESSGKTVEPAPRTVRVNHSSGEITVDDTVRRATYKPDGTTVIEIDRERDGQKVAVRFTEHPTRPHRAFVVAEARGSRELVTWIQDANSKLYRFDYNESGELRQYVDVSHSPTIVWTAERVVGGVVMSWTGHRKQDGTSIGSMMPVLESVDLSGNRHFIRQDGVRFLVGPSGAACLSAHLTEDVVSGKRPVVNFATFPGVST